MGGIAASLTRFSKECVSILKRYKCTVIGINQLRDDMNNPYNLYSTPGGKAWKFLCSVRLFLVLVLLSILRAKKYLVLLLTLLVTELILKLKKLKFVVKIDEMVFIHLNI